MTKSACRFQRRGIYWDPPGKKCASETFRPSSTAVACVAQRPPHRRHTAYHVLRRAVGADADHGWREHVHRGRPEHEGTQWSFFADPVVVWAARCGLARSEKTSRSACRRSSTKHKRYAHTPIKLSHLTSTLQHRVGPTGLARGTPCILNCVLCPLVACRGRVMTS